MEIENPLEQENEQILASVQKDTFEDRAYGCILGAFIADACGAFYEFNYAIATEEQMDACMSMPGGGAWACGSGQITDDSELAICFMHAIVQANQNTKPDEEFILPTKSIAHYYG